MRRQFVILSLAAVCLTLNSPVLATDRLVPSQYPTIQAGIDAAINGDVVIVAQGTYIGDGNRDIDFKGKAITVQSVDPCDQNVVAATVIDCQGSSGDYHRGFYFHNGETYSSVLAGLKIINGYAWDGGGILCRGSSPTITHCVIAGNSSYWGGGGIMSEGYETGPEPPFEVVESNPKISQCAITGNSTGGYGGGIRSSIGNPTIRNCTITGNRINASNRGGGGIYFYDARPTVSNCTISANQGGNRGGGIYCYLEVNATIRNCIFWNNEASGAAEFYLYAASNELSVSYCDIEGGWEGVNNIDDDPCFVAPGHWDTNGLWLHGDYHLSVESPCINAGNPAYNPAPSVTDIDGEPRVINACVDMGSDELNGEGPVIKVWPLEFEFFAIEGGTNPESQILSIRNRGLGTLNWEIMEDCDWLEAVPDTGSSMGEVNDISISVDTSDLKAGFYSCVLIVSGVDVLGSKYTIPINFWISEAVVYVPKQYPTIQEAIDEVADGVVVIVEPNTYTGHGNKNLDFGGKAITVRSIDPEDPCVVAETVIDCENNGRGFYFHSGEEADSVLSGFTIKRGRVQGRPARGGGIYCSGASPTIINCVITGNQALGSGGNPHGGNAYGGGVYCESNSYLTLTDCTLSSNRAAGGHGDSLWCSPMSGCSGGLGGGGDGYGGAIYSSSDSSLSVVGCIISGNSAAGGSGGVWYDTGAPIEGANGGWAWGGGVYCGSVATIINNCSIVNNTAAGGNGGRVDDPYCFDGERGMVFGGGACGKITISNSIISSNYILPGTGELWVPKSGGGGICCTASSSIVNCLISDNSATSAFFSTGIHLLFNNNHSIIKGCTISNNTADYDPYAVDDADNLYTVSATITDSIIWGHGGRDVSGVCSVTYSCTEQNVSGTGNIHDEPRFVTGPLGYYYLSQTAAGQAVDSPCVDAGSDTAANLGMDICTTRTDHIGDANVVDMGYHYPLPNPADISGQGGVDFIDYAILASQWKQEPSILSADIFPAGGDCIVDEKDLAFLVKYWLWGK